MQVVDLTGAVRDWGWLTARYGRLVVRPAPMGRLGWCYRLVEVRECAGLPVLRVRVEDAEGQAMPAMVALTWPELERPAGDLPRVGAEGWAERAVLQRAGPNGWAEFGLGRDSWIADPAVGGPYHVWVQSEAYDSDCLSWAGWLPTTDYQGPMSLTFRLCEAQSEPADGVDVAALRAAVRTLAQALVGLATGVEALEHLLGMTGPER